MKKRNLLAVFALSVVTFGIYDIYWLVQTKKELNAKTRTHVPTIWLLFVPLILVVVAFILLFAGLASTAHNAHTVYNADGSYTTVTTGSATATGAGALGFLVSILAFVVAIPCTFFWFFKYSKAVNEYTNGKMSTAMTFLLLWLLHYIGVLFVQDAFNEMIDNGTVPGQGMMPAGNMPMGQPAYAAGPQPVVAAPMGQPQGIPQPMPAPMQPVAPAPQPAPMGQPQPAVITPTQPPVMPAPVGAPTMQMPPSPNDTPPGPTLVQ